ncbi:MAG: hypothetical protein M3Q75_11855, partial [Gemmatimonadota bacterium]|nr:hypothetical protein [Gemmatimonadota bacterium]
TGQFLEGPAEEGTLLTAKPAEDGDGIILRLQNLRAASRDVSVRFPSRGPRTATLTSPVEIDGEALPIVADSLTVPLAPLAIQSVRVRF